MRCPTFRPWIIGWALWLPSCVAAQVHVVDGFALGRFYNEAWNDWDDCIVSVYYDEGGIATIRAGKGRGAVRARLNPKQRSTFVADLERGLSIVEQAHRERREVIETLGEYLHGQGVDRNGLALTAFARDAGRDPAVILYVKDFENRSDAMQLYLDPEQVLHLIGLLRQVPS